MFLIHGHVIEGYWHSICQFYIYGFKSLSQFTDDFAKQVEYCTRLLHKLTQHFLEFSNIVYRLIIYCCLVYGIILILDCVDYMHA